MSKKGVIDAQAKEADLRHEADMLIRFGGLPTAAGSYQPASYEMARAVTPILSKLGYCMVPARGCKVHDSGERLFKIGRNRLRSGFVPNDLIRYKATILDLSYVDRWVPKRIEDVEKTEGGLNTVAALRLVARNGGYEVIAEYFGNGAEPAEPTEVSTSNVADGSVASPTTSGLRNVNDPNISNDNSPNAAYLTNNGLAHGPDASAAVPPTSDTLTETEPPTRDHDIHGLHSDSEANPHVGSRDASKSVALSSGEPSPVASDAHADADSLTQDVQTEPPDQLTEAKGVTSVEVRQNTVSPDSLSARIEGSIQDEHDDELPESDAESVHIKQEQERGVSPYLERGEDSEDEQADLGTEGLDRFETSLLSDEGENAASSNTERSESVTANPQHSSNTRSDHITAEIRKRIGYRFIGLTDDAVAKPTEAGPASRVSSTSVLMANGQHGLQRATQWTEQRYPTGRAVGPTRPVPSRLSIGPFGPEGISRDFERYKTATDLKMKSSQDANYAVSRKMSALEGRRNVLPGIVGAPVQLGRNTAGYYDRIHRGVADANNDITALKQELAGKIKEQEEQLAEKDRRITGLEARLEQTEQKQKDFEAQVKSSMNSSRTRQQSAARVSDVNFQIANPARRPSVFAPQWIPLKGQQSMITSSSPQHSITSDYRHPGDTAAKHLSSILSRPAINANTQLQLIQAKPPPSLVANTSIPSSVQSQQAARSLAGRFVFVFKKDVASSSRYIQPLERCTKITYLFGPAVQANIVTSEARTLAMLVPEPHDLSVNRTCIAFKNDQATFDNWHRTVSRMPYGAGQIRIDVVPDIY